jgi:glucans biosynthesis protein
MHGGTNPGAPKGNRNAWKHGSRSAEAMGASRYVQMIAKLLNDAGS